MEIEGRKIPAEKLHHSCLLINTTYQFVKMISDQNNDAVFLRKMIRGRCGYTFWWVHAHA